MRNDLFFLKKTFELARKGEGKTSPNPMVGAVVTKNGRIIATGYHRKAGLPHAEIEALEKSTVSVRGATLYVNLEPCCIWGRTPPCVDRIVQEGIRRVVISNLDPNPCIRGRSVRKLRAAGISVEAGLLREEGERLNEIFLKNMKEAFPFVVIKSAMSLDGKTATGRGESRWITGEKARTCARKLRDKYDAVCVGAGTVRKDDPHLGGYARDPYAVVIDPALSIPLSARVLRERPGKVILVVSPDARMKEKKFAALNKKCRVICVRKKGAEIDLKAMLKALYTQGVCSLFVEGGAYTSGRFFDRQCVDKIYFFIAPKILGGAEALPVIGGKGVRHPGGAPGVEKMKIERIGEDFLVEGYPRFRK